MSGQPIVPSKDALRALRSLAHFSPAALVGTAGALCGVAALHYTERSKLRRVEKILETKRKLHSISKGRGSAQLALMFDAAERGEDFTISRNRVSRPSRGRRQSGLAIQHERSENTDWTPFVEESGSSIVATNPPPACYRDDLTEKLIQDTIRTPVGLKPLDSSGPISTPTGYQIPKNKLWDEMQRITIDRRRRDSVKIRQILRRTSESKPHKLRGPVKQSFTDLNPPPEDGDIDLNFVGDARVVRVLDNPTSRSIVLDVDNLNLFSNNSFSSLQPWPSIEEAEEGEQHRQTQERSCDQRIEDVDLYIRSDTKPPDYEIQDAFPSRYDLTVPRVAEGMKLIGIERYEYVYTEIMKAKLKYGTEQALSLLERTMDRYTGTDIRLDFALVQALFLDCLGSFGSKNMTQVAWRFVAKFLRGDTPRLEVVAFLYPKLGAGFQSDPRFFNYPAHRYLENICKGCSLDEQANELRKVVLGTQMAGIDLHEHLMIPVLRSFCHAGRMSAAQALFDEMTSVYKIETTFYTLQVLVKGYAKVGNWSKVKAILDDCHVQGLSLARVYGISGLMVSIIRDYAVSEPLEKVITFAMHTIRSYGIHPVSGITREIISICIRHRSYNWIVTWLKMVRTEFPFIETGTTTAHFAFEIACAWKDINASCEDILYGCTAIARHSLRDPFSNLFRATISEAATRHLSSRLGELKSVFGSQIPDTPIVEVTEFQARLEELRKNLAPKTENLRARLLLTDLHYQFNALRSLFALCSGSSQLSGPIPHSLPRGSDDQNSTRQPVARFLPPLSAIQNTLMEKYTQREKAGELIEHDDLRDRAAQLVQQGREADAFQLIQSVYESRWAQPPGGIEFDIDLFTDWMKVAWNLRSSTMLRTVLWAIVDAGPQLKVSSQIVLLARIAAPKSHQQRNKHAKIWNVDETEYLRLRLRRKRRATAPERGFQFKEWKGFGEYSEFHNQ